jgi:hypothetical protein
VLICASYPEPGVLLARHGAAALAARPMTSMLEAPPATSRSRRAVSDPPLPDAAPGKLAAGDRLTVRLQFEVDPTVTGKRSTAIELDDATTPVARVERELRVLP